MELRVTDKECWICGKAEGLTEHHTLPQHWKPRKNITVPICNVCHDRLNKEDLEGMRQFAFKMEQELGRQLSMWGTLRTSLDRYVQNQEAIMQAFKIKEVKT